MEPSIKKFLEFNGKNIYFTAADGNYYVAIKPICEALNVDYERQRRNLNSSKILGQLPSIQTVVAADGRLRKMVCLPEFFVYGWIFTIQSDSEGLEEFQWKCFEILHNYFHGAIIERNEYLKVRTQSELEMETLQLALQQTEEYKKIQELEAKRKQANKKLARLDKEAVTNQLPLWGLEAKQLLSEQTIVADGSV